MKIGYDTYYLVCTAINPSILCNLLSAGFITINILLTATFYALILRFVLRHDRQFRDKYKVSSVKSKRASHDKPPNCGNTNEVVNRREVEITKNLFLVVCLFVVCWLPNCIIISTSENSVLLLYFTLMAGANSLLNPIIYGFRHPNFREVFKRILCRTSKLPKCLNV